MNKKYNKPELNIETISTLSTIAALSVNENAADFGNINNANTWDEFKDLFE